jgi:tRNA threonylcarbamoyladenosine biosynthesis protein TsaB
MILLLDSSTPICKVTFIDGDYHYNDQWHADRQLAKGLLGYIHDQLVGQKKDWNDISAIGVFEGPGSFTGLRIGVTVLNTLADSQSLPIVGTLGDTWQADALGRLEKGDNDRIVLPFYGSEPHITTARK